MLLLWNPKSPKKEGGGNGIEENILEETNPEVENEPEDSGENLRNSRSK